MKKLLFIFNPAAGKNRIQGKLHEVVDYYTKQGYLVTCYPTQSQGDGYEFVKNLEEQYDQIVCSGGDGTLNEVVSGMLEAGKNYTLGYLPLGSTNDFARSIGIPGSFYEAMENSVQGGSFTVDIGKLQDKYFIYVAAFGIFTDVPYVTSQKLKNNFGYLAYILQGIKAISELKAYSLEVEYNGKVEKGEFIVGMITNTMSVGGFKYPWQKNIKFNDGVFEVLMIRMPKSLLDLQAIIHSLINEKVDEKYILFIQTSELKIHSEQMAWTCDGEYGGTYEKLQITNMKSAVAMRVPSVQENVQEF